MWITGVIYKHGMVGIWYTFFSAWAAISAFVSTRIFRRSLAYTQAEFNVIRFSGLGAEMLRGWMAGWQVFMNMFILGWVGIAMGLVCQYLFGWETWIGLVSFSAVCAIYVLAAGYWGVVMADFQQGIIAFLVIMIVSIWGIMEAGGPSGIVATINGHGRGRPAKPVCIYRGSAFGLGAHHDIHRHSRRLRDGHYGRLVRRGATYPVGKNRTGCQLQHLVGNACGAMVRNSVWAVAILGFYVMFPGITEVSEYEMGWFRLGFDFLPAGMLGFFFAAIIAIHLSTISSHLNLGALYATRDLYHHYWNPQATEQQLVWVGRFSNAYLAAGVVLFWFDDGRYYFVADFCYLDHGSRHLAPQYSTGDLVAL